MRQPKQAQFAPQLSVKKLTNRSLELSTLLKQARNRLSLTDLFNHSVPNLFQNKFHVNGIDEKTLTLTCHSASLMTRLRFCEQDIIKQFNLKIRPKQITNITIKIRPKTFNQKDPLNPQIQNLKQQRMTDSASKEKLSKKNAQLLLDEAEHTIDLKLKSILLRLAQHTD